MRIAVLSETDPIETRVAATPETVKKYKALGADVVVQAGAGVEAGVPDAEYEAAGATIAAGAAEAAPRRRYRPQGAPPGRRRARRAASAAPSSSPSWTPTATRPRSEGAGRRRGRRLRHGADAAHHPRAGDGRAVLAGEPRRLQGRDRCRRRVRPRLPDDDDRRRHRAGRAGLRHGRRRRRPAGDRHRAPARRGGHRDRRAPGRQGAGRVLGAKFVAVEDEEFRQAETAGGYAKEMSEEYQAKQAELVASHIAKQDIVITTALIPGRPAPRWSPRAMVAIDEAGLGHRRPRGRARRQRRAGAGRRDR